MNRVWCLNFNLASTQQKNLILVLWQSAKTTILRNPMSVKVEKCLRSFGVEFFSQELQLEQSKSCLDSH